MLSLVLGCAVLANDGRVTEVEFADAYSDWFLFDWNDDGRRDVLVLYERGGGSVEYELALHGPDGTFEERVTGTWEATAALALGTFDGATPWLVALGDDRVQFLGWNGEEGTLTEMREPLLFEGFLRAPSGGTPGFWHWSIDLDQDGFDDVFAPSEEGLALWFGRGDGTFDAVTSLALPGERRVVPSAQGAFDVSFTRPRPVFRDMDGDGRRDLTWFDFEGLSFRRQTTARVFGEVESFPLEWLGGEDADSFIERSDADLEDLDDDGRCDLVLGRMRAEEGRITDLRTTLVVLMNRGGDDGWFPRKPDLALAIEGVIGSGPFFNDTDADGHPDLSYATYGAGIGDAVSRLLGRVPVGIATHLGTGRQDEPFSATPSSSRKISIDADDFERWRAGNNVRGHEDLDGDGWADTLIIRREGDVHRVVLQRGVRKAGGLAPGPEEPSVTVEDLQSVSVRRVRDGGPQSLVLVRSRGVTFVDW